MAVVLLIDTRTLIGCDLNLKCKQFTSNYSSTYNALYTGMNNACYVLRQCMSNGVDHTR